MSENVSEELGARLLAPTPGARMLLSTVCKEEKEKEEKKNPVVKKSAKDLIQEHKQSLQFNSPKLGRGLSKTGEFSLDISPSMKKNYMNASQAKAMAILKMKGNKLAKLDPNNTHRSNKNRTPDVKEKILKRIRSEDDDDDSQGTELQRRSSKVLEKRSLMSLLKVGNLYRSSTTLGLEPVSIVHYTRLETGINHGGLLS